MYDDVEFWQHDPYDPPQPAMEPCAICGGWVAVDMAAMGTYGVVHYECWQQEQQAMFAAQGQWW